MLRFSVRGALDTHVIKDIRNSSMALMMASIMSNAVPLILIFHQMKFSSFIKGPQAFLLLSQYRILKTGSAADEQP